MKVVRLLLLQFILFILAPQAHAQIRENTFSASPYIGGYLFDDDYDLKHRPVYGLRLGYDITKEIGIEALTEYVDTKYTPKNKNASSWGYRVEGLYHFMPENDIVPFVAIGLGGINIDYPAGLEDKNRFVMDYGVGLKYFFTDNLGIRGDVRHIIPFDRPNNNLEYTFGISYYFGTKKAAVNEKPKPKVSEKVSDSDHDGVPDNKDKCPDTPKDVKVDDKGCPPDSDGDGVYDHRDKCPDTPRGVKVDDKGCPLDSDGDGVFDYRDACPDTPAGIKVDKEGCPPDSDGDGVFDYQDDCPDTPQGVKVYSNGCPIDSDGDGVFDYLDKCPDTPGGVKVDDKGCPLDSDGDGVYDHRDKCPDTPGGVKVDDKGCPFPKKVSIRLNIEFDFDKFYIKPIYNDEVKKVADFIRQYHWTMVYIEGHTDNKGSDAYNIRLSQRRADSVRQYLIDKFGITGSRLEAVGYGFRKPIADNATEKGRQINRRVEAVIETVTRP